MKNKTGAQIFKETMDKRQPPQTVVGENSHCVSSAWVWKHSNEAVDVVEECGDRIYYKVEVVRFQDKSHFKKVSNH